MNKKKIAFICVHNSCRSQIAEALGKHLASDAFDSFSAGTETKPQINQDAVRIMKDLYGIDMEATQYSKLISDIPDPDIAISMGCNVGCPFIGRAFDDNWGLEDPTGKSDEEFIKIIKQIEKNILELKENINVTEEKFSGKYDYMPQLFSIDIKDYELNYKVFSRPSARAIILDKNVIALVYSKKENYYKAPGGGIKDDEDKITALIREVKEEVGLVVKPETIKPFGSVMRRQKSNMSANTIFEQENFYYFCECENEIAEQKLDDYEKEAEFVLRYVDIDEAIKVNSEYKSDDFFDEIMIKREQKVLELIKNQIVSE